MNEPGDEIYDSYFAKVGYLVVGIIFAISLVIVLSIETGLVNVEQIGTWVYETFR